MKNKRDKMALKVILDTDKEFSKDNYIMVIPGDMSSKFVGYSQMRFDLEYALQCLEELMINKNEVIITSLTYSIVTIYGKCFTKSKVNKEQIDLPNYTFPCLEENIFKGDENLFETHKYIMNLRNNHFAHRSHTDFEIGGAFSIVPKEEGKKSFVYFSGGAKLSFDNNQISNISDLLNYVHKKVKESVEIQGTKLDKRYWELLEELKKESPESVAGMCINKADFSNLR